MMNELLEKIQREVIEEFTQNLNASNSPSINELAIQIVTISAKVTKSFIEKYEQEKSL